MLSVCLNAWTNIYETWYVYHGTWAHLNDVLQEFLPSVYMSIYVSPVVVMQRHGKDVTAATNTHAIEVLLDTFPMRSVSYKRKSGD
jgi:hypothetical protein